MRKTLCSLGFLLLAHALEAAPPSALPSMVLSASPTEMPARAGPASAKNAQARAKLAAGFIRHNARAQAPPFSSPERGG